MKKNIYFIIFIILYISTIFAREVSLGIVLGEPTGLSLKLQQNKNLVFDSGLGFNTKDDYFLFTFDTLTYNYDKIKSKEITGGFPVFYGLGLKVENARNTKLGVRFVGGIEYVFSDIPFNIFVKLSPTLDLIPETSVYISVAIGVRYILK